MGHKMGTLAEQQAHGQICIQTGPFQMLAFPYTLPKLGVGLRLYQVLMPPFKDIR